MYCKTDLDEEHLAYAHRAGFEGKDNEAFIEGQLLVQENGIWKPHTPARINEFNRCHAIGRAKYDRDLKALDLHGPCEAD